MTSIVIRGNALGLPLADNSVDLICTSPPYFSLRSYQDGGEHYAGQLGSEPTPAEFVAALVAATREMMRVLKPSGSIFVNLGDKYAPTKSLMLIPERYRIACVDELGLIARAVIVWDKPNGLPESVRDRVRRSHEDWVHFTKEPRYFSAVDEVREPVMFPNQARTMGDSANGGKHSGVLHKRQDGGANLLGKLPGSVWRIATQPLTVPASLGIDHFAAFPMEWPRRIIKGWSPREVCTACGQGRSAVWKDVGLSTYGQLKAAGKMTYGNAHEGNGSEPGNTGQTKNARGTSVTYEAKRREVTGYDCACPDTTAPTTPSVVLDPFGGTGTTALIASVLGRQGISVDMSADYCLLATWRTTDRGQIASAMQVEKPEPVDEAQYGLFGDAA